MSEVTERAVARLCFAVAILTIFPSCSDSDSALYSYGGQCEPQCEGKECGPSGCPGESCGECGENGICADGLCECTHGKCSSVCCEIGTVCSQGACCAPQCEGRNCGDNGCGGKCGDCGMHEVCENRICVGAPWCGDGQCDAASGENCEDCVADCKCKCSENAPCVDTDDDPCNGPHCDPISGYCQDEPLGNGTPCHWISSCVAGTCQNGICLETAAASTGEPDPCDGTDNDCDGRTDENCYLDYTVTGVAWYSGGLVSDQGKVTAAVGLTQMVPEVGTTTTDGKFTITLMQPTESN